MERRPTKLPRYPEVAFLNDLIGLPSPHRAAAFSTSLDVGSYLLDYNYLDRERGRACLAEIERVRRERGLDFGKKTLLLAARGLDPHNGALLDLARAFAGYHVFFELWNMAGEVGMLREARVQNLYFLPVTAALRPPVVGPMVERPNARVFASLGGDDDLDLLREVVERCPDIQFCIPDVSWEKGGAGRRELDVDIREPNVTRVPCKGCKGSTGSTFTDEYRLAYASCDTVLLATRADKRSQMRGGIRVADALDAQKRLVMTENPLCELLMAQHEKTCLVTRHDAGEIERALQRIASGGFQPDEALCEEIRALTWDEPKLAWMVRAAEDPGAARRSAFYRDAAGLDLAALPRAAVGVHAVDALFDLARGQALPLPGGGAFRVEDIAQESETRFSVTLARAGARPLLLLVSTAPVERYYKKTRRGHCLSYRGSDLTREEARVVEDVARRV